jgi:hypothetical protein
LAVCGFKGTLVTSKVCICNKIYYLKRPVEHKNVSVYALFSKEEDRFIGFCTDSEYCFNFDRNEDVLNGVILNGICPGNMPWKRNMSLTNARKKCIELVGVLDVANADSSPTDGSEDESLDEFIRMASNYKPVQEHPDFDKYLVELI